MTAELGPDFFYAFESQVRRRVRRADASASGRAPASEVIAPPDYAMYSYDCVNVLAQALRQCRRHERPVARRSSRSSARGANGDERGFNQHNHEGVIDDDVFFARFHDMTFAPVKDDPLSATLPTIQQTRH